MNPRSAPPNTIKALFNFLNPKTVAMLSAAINSVRQSVKESLAISKQTATITPTAAIFTVSKKADSAGDFLILWTNGFNRVTKMKEGINIPIVAAIAPGKPPSWYPIKVAVDNTGPGVT